MERSAASRIFPHRDSGPGTALRLPTLDCTTCRNARDTKQKWPGLLPAILPLWLSPQRGGTVPGGGGGSEACPPLSSGVMRRTVTRRLIRLGPSVCSFRYCLP